MIEHTLRTITLKNGNFKKTRRVFRFADPQYSIIAEFFFTEADQFRREIRDAVDPVRMGDADEASFAGNKYGFALFNDSAVIFDQMSEPIEFVQIPQEDFFGFLNEWYITADD